jgi:DNA-binding NarL/FixJ family response regulator
MFQKILISDDLGCINEGVSSVLEALAIKAVSEVQYCDDAYLKIKAGYRDEEPYDLFITDLSFDADHRLQQFISGEKLVEKLKLEHPDLKIIVFSVEDKLQKVRSLIKDHHLDGYVCKGRKGLSDLKKAIKNVYKNKPYLSLRVRHALEEKTSLEISDFDIMLIEKLSLGLSQDDMSIAFKKQDITPSSLSSIEKHINKLKIQFRANNVTHLVAISKDLGLI